MQAALRELIGLFDTVPAADRPYLVSKIAQHMCVTAAPSAEGLIEWLVDSRVIIPVSGSIEPLIEAIPWNHKDFQTSLKEFADRKQKCFPVFSLEDSEVLFLARSWFCYKDKLQPVRLIALYAKVAIPTHHDQIPALFLTCYKDDRMAKFFAAIGMIMADGAKDGITGYELEQVGKIRSEFEKHPTGNVILRQAAGNKLSRSIISAGADKRQKRENALTALAAARKLSEPELRTYLNDVELLAALNRDIPQFLDGKSFAQVLSELPPIWADLADALINIITDKQLFNQTANVQALQASLEKIKANADVTELLCWNEPSPEKRKIYIYENLFSKGMVLVSTFFNRIGEPLTLAQPQRFKTIDPEHMKIMFNKFLLGVRDPHTKLPLGHTNLTLLEQMMEKSPRAAPLATIARVLLPSADVDAKDLVMPRYELAKEFSFATAFADLVAACGEFSTSGVAEKYLATMQLWKDRNLFATTSRDDLVQTLCGIFYPDTEGQGDRTPALLLIAEFEQHGVVEFKE